MLLDLSIGSDPEVTLTANLFAESTGEWRLGGVVSSTGEKVFGDFSPSAGGLRNIMADRSE
jgi:hypothetical protein